METFPLRTSPARLSTCGDMSMVGNMPMSMLAERRMHMEVH